MDKINKDKPDGLTLDVEMPRMDGVEFLRRLMPQNPIPVVMVSSLTQKGKQITLDALEAGAVDFASKPSTDIARGLGSMIMELRTKVKIASIANVSSWKKSKTSSDPDPVFKSSALAESTDKVIAIGASTGGTEAIRKVITRFPPSMPGVVIVQHMPPVFTKMFADRLNNECEMVVEEAKTNDRVMSGRVLIAPGDMHLTIKRSGGIYQVVCSEGEKVCGHRPSVEVMMNSVAKYVGANAIGIILTGMGRDGSEGMLSMRQAGAKTMAQDEKTSVVFGMPKEAYKNGGAQRLLPLEDIAEETLRLLAEKAA
ncbi:chemotaxis response regulator protein-glutamate methylesterase, partial [candidate division KSB1 bacterium]|nr:chemotaxis response regulator protein-glutamate methylesterase [candidate division KSB1 bacterium]